MEKLIAYFCGPALAGIKPSNIVNCQKSDYKNISDTVRTLNGQLNCRDIYFEILYEYEKSVLIMVYRKKLLENHLNREDSKAFLKKYGYKEYNTLNEHISFLKSRIKKYDFPHEIGIFLGYPIHDVEGFINHRNEGFILSGEWKVYENAAEAKKLFKRFSDCRRSITRRILNGQTLAQIFCVL